MLKLYRRVELRLEERAIHGRARDKKHGGQVSLYVMTANGQIPDPVLEVEVVIHNNSGRILRNSF